MYLGIDGCRSGWVVACITHEGFLRFELIGELSALASFSPVAGALIDIPIGFPESEYRACDREACELLKPLRHSSIFFTPTREALYADSYEKGCELNYRSMGKKFSKQMWAIRRKIISADEYLKEPEHVPLRESHPELCFRSFNGAVCRFSKKTSEGRDERLAIIGRTHPDYPAAIEEFTGRTKRKEVLPDDIIDAAILAVTASTPDRLRCIPGSGDVDAEGRRCEIVFPKDEEVR